MDPRAGTPWGVQQMMRDFDDRADELFRAVFSTPPEKVAQPFDYSGFSTWYSRWKSDSEYWWITSYAGPWQTWEHAEALRTYQDQYLSWRRMAEQSGMISRDAPTVRQPGSIDAGAIGSMLGGGVVLLAIVGVGGYLLSQAGVGKKLLRRLK